MTSDKLRNIEHAQRITERVFADVLAMLAPGVTELEIVQLVRRRAKEYGASKLSFDPIVATGRNAVAPHATPGNRKLRNGHLLVIDLGVVFGGYCSDMTRTMAIGKPSAEQRKVYGVVRRAQRSAIAAARPGMNGKELDAVARDIITQAGYGKYFVHTLGHGVGRKVHQLPRISPKRYQTLKAGDVITFEPGIYLPGKFGVRIEDMLVLTSRGHRNLTRVPTRLISV